MSCTSYEGCMWRTLLLSTPKHIHFYKCYSATWLEEALKNYFVWIMTVPKVNRSEQVGITNTLIHSLCNLPGLLLHSIILATHCGNFDHAHELQPAREMPLRIRGSVNTFEPTHRLIHTNKCVLSSRIKLFFGSKYPINIALPHADVGWLAGWLRTTPGALGHCYLWIQFSRHIIKVTQNLVFFYDTTTKYALCRCETSMLLYKSFYPGYSVCPFRCSTDGTSPKHSTSHLQFCYKHAYTSFCECSPSTSYHTPELKRSQRTTDQTACQQGFHFYGEVPPTPLQHCQIHPEKAAW